MDSDLFNLDRCLVFFKLKTLFIFESEKNKIMLKEID